MLLITRDILIQVFRDIGIGESRIFFFSIEYLQTVRLFLAASIEVLVAFLVRLVTRNATDKIVCVWFWLTCLVRPFPHCSKCRKLSLVSLNLVLMYSSFRPTYILWRVFFFFCLEFDRWELIRCTSSGMLEYFEECELCKVQKSTVSSQLFLWLILSCGFSSVTLVWSIAGVLLNVFGTSGKFTTRNF